MVQSAQQQAKQASFPGMCPVEDALTMLAQSGIEERGAIFTRREVVEFILDLIGYTADQPLYAKRLLEPVPIRLSPIPTTSRVLPIPRVKLGLGRAAISPAMSSAS